MPCVVVLKVSAASVSSLEPPVPVINVQPASPIASERSPIEVKTEVPSDPTPPTPAAEVSPVSTPSSVPETLTSAPVESPAASTPATAPMSPDSTTQPETPAVFPSSQCAGEPEAPVAPVSETAADLQAPTPAPEKVKAVSEPVQIVESSVVAESSVVSVPEPADKIPKTPEVNEVLTVVESNIPIPDILPSVDSPASESTLSESAPLPDPIDTPVVSESTETSQLPPPPEDLSLESKDSVVVNGISPVDEIPPPLPTSEVLETAPSTVAEAAEKTEQTTRDEINVGELAGRRHLTVV